GSTHIVSANDFGPEVQFTFESFLKPTTLYAEIGKDAPSAIKSLPARFDASGLVTEQFETASKDGTKIPYFVVRPKNATAPAPTACDHGRFERRTARERQYGRATGSFRRRRLPGAADRHDPLHADRSRRVVAGGIRRSQKRQGARVDPEILALSERESRCEIS